MENGIELEEMAVLYRAHYQSMEVQMELTARDLPFQITSGLRFFEQAHVKDVSSYIRFVVNRRDEVSFKRMVLMMPSVGDASADKLWRAWLACPLANMAEVPEVFSKTLLEFKVPAKARPYWEQICYTLDELVVGEGYSAPSDMIFSVLEGVYDDYMKDSLSQLSLMTNVDGEVGDKQNKKQEEGIHLSSIHQAKGLEWKVVFLVWLADGMFPNGRILEADDNKMLEEERRLFYVALTRAKDQLYLSYPMMNPD